MAGDPITTLREIVDTLHEDYVDYNKCRRCPLGDGSVCFPNCAEWKIGKDALAQVEALAEAAQEWADTRGTDLRHGAAVKLVAALAPFVAHKDTNHA